jgi:anti-anti-sigma factor
MDVIEQQDGGVVVLEIRGRIDTTTSKEFGDRLTGLLKSDRKRIVIDLRETRYISSAGFRALLIAAKLAEEVQGKLVLTALSAELTRLFDLGAFTDLFAIFASREEGIATCNA